MNKTISILALLFSIIIAFTSCTKDESEVSYTKDESEVRGQVLYIGAISGIEYVADGAVATGDEIWYLPMLLEGMVGPSE